jgi:hypothetical protein
MGHLRKRWFAAILALTATVTAALAASAAAEVVFRETFHDEGTIVFEDFCDVSGLTVEFTFSVEGRVKAVPHGRDGLIYFLEHIKGNNVYTNLDNDKFMTEVFTQVNKDLRVTDNGDGTLTILVLATGNAALYGADGKAIARNPGQVRFAFIVDHGGTPTDPEDDVFLEDLGLVKGSTGRTDDFCEAAVPALS